MREVKIVQTGEEIKSQSGIFPAGRLLRKFGFEELSNLDNSPTKDAEYSSCDLFLSYAGMMCLGQRDFCDMNKFRGDRMFKHALGIDKVPSESTLRDRIGGRPESYEALRRINSDAVWDAMRPSPAVVGGRKLYFADLDVSVHDNSGARKREGVGMTYKGVLGFSPAYLYVGKEGYMLDSELRPGEQHCQPGTPALMQRAMLGAERRGKRLLFRMDSGNDSSENILLCHGRGHSYIIACNPRRMDLTEPAEEAEAYGEWIERTSRKDVFIHKDEFWHRPGKGRPVKAFRVVRLEITYEDEFGQKLLVPEKEVSMWWTDLDIPAADVIRLYNDHGTSEQYHSELKTDMDMERFPALSFEANKVVHASAMIAFNVLRRMGVDAAALLERRERPERLRIRTVILEIARAAGKFVFSGNRFFLKMSSGSESFRIVSTLYHAYG